MAAMASGTMILLLPEELLLPDRAGYLLSSIKLPAAKLVGSDQNSERKIGYHNSYQLLLAILESIENKGVFQKLFQGLQNLYAPVQICVASPQKYSTFIIRTWNIFW